MAPPKKVTRSMQSSVKPQPSTKINWIFSAMKRSSFQVRAICNAFFSDDKELKSDTFNYVSIGIKRSSDKGLYDIYGYLQLKSGRWTNKELLNWVRYPVTGYLSTDRIFQRIEKEWKPHDVVLHIKSIADVSFTEGGEIRTKGPKKRDSEDLLEESNSESSPDDLEEELDDNPFLQSNEPEQVEEKPPKLRKTSANVLHAKSSSAVELHPEITEVAEVQIDDPRKKINEFVPSSPYIPLSSTTGVTSPEPRRLVSYNTHIREGLTSRDPAIANSEWRDALLNSMEEMMNRILSTHLHAFCDDVIRAFQEFQEATSSESPNVIAGENTIGCTTTIVEEKRKISSAAEEGNNVEN